MTAIEPTLSSDICGLLLRVVIANRPQAKHGNIVKVASSQDRVEPAARSAPDAQAHGHARPCRWFGAKRPSRQRASAGHRHHRWVSRSNARNCRIVVLFLLCDNVRQSDGQIICAVAGAEPTANLPRTYRSP